MMLCAICSLDPATGRIGTNETTRICDACKQSPYNQDWIEPPARERVTDETDDGYVRHLSMILDRPQRNPTAIQRKVLRLAISGSQVQAKVIDSRGRSRGTRTYSIALSYRAIATLAHCHPSYVQRICRL